ncbi:MAG: DUF4234 domain-containing protein [Oscillospiraceae bacterium]|jgi:hypothetical protein|nr:DUF4234 domain-containing protein [Oscillospiraceae bacterium]
MSQFETQQQPYVPSPAPVGQLNTSRSLLKLILLSFITFGIYSIVFYSGISTDINIVASRYDGKRTMHFCLLIFLVTPFTLGIGALVWNHRLAGRMGRELQRRGVQYSFDSGTFWLWSVLGAMIVVGPFVYIHKLAKASRLMNQHYNTHG